ncbi:MAG: PfkB family carbohydrate kinase [Acidobacteriota bacterium]|nr:PfkB family carbohydrate kinase [Acidobacteriota bacterium]
MSAAHETPTRDRLVEIVGSFSGRRIAVLADLVVDRFIHGTPKRISREAPVLILRQDREQIRPGGGANAVMNVRALGGNPCPVGVVGDDHNGSALLEHFSGAGIDTGQVVEIAGYRTPTKTRVLAGAKHSAKQQIVRFDVEEELNLDEEANAALAQALDRACESSSALIVSDYGLGGIDPRLASHASRGRLCLADSRYRLTDFEGVDGATPNEEELDALEPGDPADAPRRGERLRQRLGASFLLLTRGSTGMVLVTEAAAVEIPVHGTDQIADVTGAGDTVIGAFALASAAGATPLEAALLANYAGGIVVTKLGTATASQEELTAAIGADGRPLGELKWVDW